jgi:hypothetical protein
MNKNASNGKKLGLRVETLRNLSVTEMNQIKGGFNWAGCWTVTVPSSAITMTYPLATTYCD